MIRNILTISAVILVYLSYLLLISERVPADDRLLINFLVVPILLGVCGVIALSREIGAVTRIALIAATPILPILIFGGDPAKPGLELILIGPLALMFSIGAAIGIALQMMLKRKYK